MRHISIKPLEEMKDWPPEKWHERAQKALDELRNLPPGKKRADVFEKNGILWSELKDDLRKLSHGKCWYCETRIDRDFGDIDHFRPKGKVEGVPDHPGYWWLAFEWRNFRFSCKLCNVKEIDHDAEDGDGRGGKGAQFPLLDGEKYRICDAGEYEEYEDLLDEHPLLLDPTEKRDPLLLTFTRDGQPAPSMKDETASGYRRAKASIYIYHLDYSRLNRERQKIYYKMRRLVRNVQRYQERWEKEHDRSARALSRAALDEIVSLIAPDAQYSAAARAYLKEYREQGADWDWVDELLTAS
jgi:uncharacterized protein (TIGR02646 family)